MNSFTQGELGPVSILSMFTGLRQQSRGGSGLARVPRGVRSPLVDGPLQLGRFAARLSQVGVVHDQQLLPKHLQHSHHVRHRQLAEAC